MDSCFSLIFDEPQQFVDFLSRYKYIKLFVDTSVDANLFAQLKSLINSAGAKYVAICTSSFLEKDASKLEFSGEDLVVAAGGLNLQSVAKYYAYSYCVEYAIVPAHEVCDYTFSSFAFLQDNIFSFYQCEPPKIAYIISSAFSEADKDRMYHILSYKNISLWEKEFENLILGAPNFSLDKMVNAINLCQKRLMPIIKLFAGIGSAYSNTNINFFGGEYALLRLCSGKDMPNLILKRQSLLAKFYQCMMHFPPFMVQVDINKHIKKLKEIYNLDYLSISGSLQWPYSAEKIKELYGKFGAYYPHLKELLTRCDSRYDRIKIEIDKETENALALSSDVCAATSVVRFARELGYFENLVKSL